MEAQRPPKRQSSALNWGELTRGGGVGTTEELKGDKCVTLHSFSWS